MLTQTPGKINYFIENLNRQVAYSKFLANSISQRFYPQTDVEQSHFY